MILKDVAGILHKRRPNFGLNSSHKVLYITYPLLLEPLVLSVTNNIPATREVISDTFTQSLKEYGFDIENLKDWTLFIDARADWWLPHDEIKDILETLSSIFEPKNIHILSNSVFDSTDVKYTIEFHAGASANLFGYYDHLVQSNIDFKSIVVDKHFIALARRPTKNRVLLVKRLLDLFSKDLRASCGSGSPKDSIIHKNVEHMGGFTYIVDRAMYWHYLDNIQNGTDITDENAKILRSYEVKSTVSFQELFAPYDYPLNIEDSDIIDNVQQHTALDQKFFSAMVNIICETTEHDHQPINLSEKTFKAFAWHQIPVWHASPGHAKVTRDLGFDLFDDIINHDYDSITTYNERTDKLIESLINFKNAYPDVNKLRTMIWDRLENNNKLLAKLVEEERLLEVENLFKTGKHVST
jgi:hypothetical protein